MYIYINNTKHNWVKTEEEAQLEVDFLAKEFENAPIDYVIDIRFSDPERIEHNVVIPKKFQVFQAVSKA